MGAQRLVEWKKIMTHQGALSYLGFNLMLHNFPLGIKVRVSKSNTIFV